MFDYCPPHADIQFVLEELAGFNTLNSLPNFSSISKEDVVAILDQAGRFGSEILSPLNQTGDQEGAKLKNGMVSTPAGFQNAYKAYQKAGWGKASANIDFGGQGLPRLITTALFEIWNSSNLSFALCNTLTDSAVTLLAKHATAELKTAWLPRLVSGDWTGAMAITEPHAGSDIGALTCRAVPDGEAFRIKGQKIFISWGDHDLTDNIVHLLLARTPDSPRGSNGISLFMVPKFLINQNGEVGERNEVRCLSIEKKLGIHASPTCLMEYGSNKGALGWLIGEKNRGLSVMFTMMNTARLAIGHQGLGIAERAFQQAKNFANSRVQGCNQRGKPATIINHPDVRRMLLSMKGQVEAMRALCYDTALSVDLSENHQDSKTRALHQRRVSLLTPIIKAWCTDRAVQIASLNIQVHGGAGYIEQTGAAQLYRDARITPIYEGTNGIQAIDLIKRRLISDEGFMMNVLIEEIRQFDGILSTVKNNQLISIRGRLAEAGAALSRATHHILNAAKINPEIADAGAVPYLFLAGTVLGGYHMARAAFIAETRLSKTKINNPKFYEAKIATALNFSEAILPKTAALEKAATSGGAVVANTRIDLI